MFQGTRYKIIMVENCKNIVEGMNEDRDEALCMTGYLKTFNGNIISNQMSKDRRPKKSKK